MRAWIVRFGALLVFNLVVIVLIVLFTPGVRGVWGALWAALVLTVATVWIKPLVTSFLTDRAGRWTSKPSWLAGKVLTYAIIYAVAFVVWWLTVVLTSVRVGGWFSGYLLPPVFLLVSWFVYDLVDDRLERVAGNVYDAAERRAGGNDRPRDAGTG